MPASAPPAAATTAAAESAPASPDSRETDSRDTNNVNVREFTQLISPTELAAEYPATAAARSVVQSGREQIKRVLAGEDERLLCVVGPCSIHDEQAALEYAAKLKAVAAETEDKLLIVMRVYFEKPRTTVGWKGLISDPGLNEKFDMAEGLRKARRILLEIADLGLPAATEMLEPITPQYIADLIALASIGARTTESPCHRQMSSGLSMPVGYKNGTDGSLQTALNAMTAARAGHSFLGIDPDGKTCIVRSAGNPWGHLILRGGHNGPNYDAESIAKATAGLIDDGLPPRFLVDCSHANSGKDPLRQPSVWQNVLGQRLDGNDSIIGMMLESNLYEGNQSLTPDAADLKYGVSVTDGCLGWEDTETLLRETYAKLAS
ncbi:3-deoxy-7-phosphoheptulonate synthase [Alienimonas chondri]|uniref:Phospho-2-dehydro-3-deoxyheptonate aldolase n=1 Tax=Alienimonas chondri TaxID=2681879 RepID=A0ABX1VC73_9PLAN|nr:3-deoxy-7-phosphoheptulonate synthase [Alienimonas chondri]NNJ25708.1 Phospho-2-dehydro-3-deoxyheptonate aldolase, Tyr-sensitive [Alienimonas chondri]